LAFLPRAFTLSPERLLLDFVFRLLLAMPACLKDEDGRT
jgi:hypothetical protein